MNNKYYHTKESVDEYIRMAEGYSGKHIIEKLKEFLPEKSKILELGSGPGTDWQILSKDYHIIGSDYSSEFLNYLRNQNPGSRFLNLDAIHIKTKLDFDCIYSNKVLHHLTTKELKTAIKRQFDILNPHGVICHSF